MRLLDLDPVWILRDGRRIGFTFRSPLPDKREWFQSCFVEPVTRHDQWKLLREAVGGQFQSCNEACQWTVANGIENASFETITVTPSLDGSRGGLWHGFVTDGQIVGGL